jgi:dihydrodipicolinate synthase/N-acetylneuraminate lyase
MSRLLRHVVENGIETVLVLGSSGEGAALPRPVRHAVVTHACHEVGETVRVLACVSGSCVDEVASEARSYLAVGVDAVLTPPPLYGPGHPARTELFYRGLADAGVGPVIGYHIPRLTGTPISSEVVEKLARDGVLVGIKDSGRDLEYLQDVARRLADLPDFDLLAGVDSLLLPSLQLGATGSITVGANLVPALVRSLYEALDRSALGEAVGLNHRLARLAEILRSGVFPAGAKAAAEWAGLCRRWTAVPTPALDESDVAGLGSLLEAIGVGVHEGRAERGAG